MVKKIYLDNNDKVMSLSVDECSACWSMLLHQLDYPIKPHELGCVADLCWAKMRKTHIEVVGKVT